jgi:predicted RNase H-like HicB family nuclease
LGREYLGSGTRPQQNSWEYYVDLDRHKYRSLLACFVLGLFYFKANDRFSSLYFELCLNLKYLISIIPEEGGGFTALIPDLPGCMTQGKTIEEVVVNIEEAKRLWIETVYLNHGEN